MKGAGPVFLTGLMGSGKTTVGRLLAGHLGWRWVDLDSAIEKRTGQRIATIFCRQGESAFRRLEAVELQRWSKQKQVVVSCGGGVVLLAGNRKVLKASPTIYLAVSPLKLAQRLQGAENDKRPLLRGRDRLGALRRLQRERARFYRACATFVLLAQAKPEALAKRAFHRLQRIG